MCTRRRARSAATATAVQPWFDALDDDIVLLVASHISTFSVLTLLSSCKRLCNLLHLHGHRLVPAPSRPLAKSRDAQMLSGPTGLFPPGTVVCGGQSDDQGLCDAVSPPHGRQPRASKARSALENGAQINGTYGDAENGFYWSTPLGFACALGHMQLVRWLLVNGADPNGVDACGYRPLHRCIEGGPSQAPHRNEHHDVALLLLRAGANPRLRRFCRHRGVWELTRTPLESALAVGARRVGKLLAAARPRWRMLPRAELEWAEVHRPQDEGA